MSYLAGLNGVFSSSERTLGQQLADPQSRAGAVSHYAADIATSIASGHQTTLNAVDARDCPAPYAARASSLIDELDPNTAASLLSHAAVRLGQIGWQVDASSGRVRSSVHAHNRRGLELSVVEILDADSSALQVSITLPCTVAESTGGPTRTHGSQPAADASTTTAN
jgi:hypothetical protein